MNIKYIKEVAEALYEKHAALMVGAGFSKNAEKISATDKRFLNWHELSDKFFDAIYDKDDESEKKYKSSLSLAQEVEITIGRPKLEKIIKDAVPDLEYAPSNLHVNLMELPWNDVFTTNYDTLLERAAEIVIKRRYNVVVCHEDLVNSNDAPRIIKLHGSFPSQRPFIITEEDYRTYPIKFAAMVNTVQQALLENVFCMIGFSCEDPNFINWIGWIHDNLGKSSSQKIYMISVSHMSEAKQKLLFERNIAIIDLEEIWPKEDFRNRLKLFIEEVQHIIMGKEKKDNWFDYSQFNITNETSFEEKIEIMHELNTTYPGWIFLPWKMKNKTNDILRKLNHMDGFDNIEFQEKINYMYEYVKLMNISGRPILSQVVGMFWEILTNIEGNEYPKEIEDELKKKAQIVYLHLLRSYRELADWEMYDECHERINTDYLDYEDKQFMYACDCWSDLFRFRSENLTNILEEWKLASGDMYWPLIKASMYALIGETSKADEILLKTLVMVRRQLVKNSRNEYLSSIEESVVSLINFIRQGNNSGNFENCIHDGDVSLWDENDKYCSNLNAETKMHKHINITTNFDLSSIYTTHWGNEYSDILYALEYNRFLEQTGHPLRLQNITNTKGLHSIINKLAPFYPHWCLMQILIAQDNNSIDLLFGRVKLSEYTRKEIDNLTREYIKIFQTVIKNVNYQNWFFAKSIYEQAAGILPEIISRFCYKCSVEVLDEILNITLELCRSSVVANFKKINKLLSALLVAYTTEEQRIRINKILEFPIENDRHNGYYDPVRLIDEPKKKYILNINVYDRVILQIKQALENGDQYEQKAANDRLFYLDRVIKLAEDEKILLCNNLEKQETLESKYRLYEIDNNKYRQNLNLILNDTIDCMKLDSNSSRFATSFEEYEKLICIIKVLDVLDINIIEVFEIMRTLVETNLSWISREKHQAKERVYQSFLIAIGLLVLCKKENKKLNNEEKEKIRDYFKSLEKVYGQSFVFKIVLCFFSDENHVSVKKVKTSILLADKDEIDLLQGLYYILKEIKYEVITDDILLEYTRIIFEVISYKIIDIRGTELESILWLLYTMLENDILVEGILTILEVALLKLIKDTCIERGDSEHNGLIKHKCRIVACKIAKELYVKGIRIEAVKQWKLISQSEDEFIEVRQIDFEMNCN